MCAFLLSRHKFALLLSGLSWGLGSCPDLPRSTALFSAFPFVPGPDRTVVPVWGLLVCALQCVLGLSSCSQHTWEEAVWLMVLRGSSSPYKSYLRERSSSPCSLWPGCKKENSKPLANRSKKLHLPLPVHASCHISAPCAVLFLASLVHF